MYVCCACCCVRGKALAASYMVTFVVMTCQTFLHIHRTRGRFAFCSCYRSLYFFVNNPPLEQISELRAKKTSTVKAEINKKLK